MSSIQREYTDFLSTESREWFILGYGLGNAQLYVLSPGLIVVVVAAVVVVVAMVGAVTSTHSVVHSALNVALYSLPLPPQSLVPDTTLVSLFVYP